LLAVVALTAAALAVACHATGDVTQATQELPGEDLVAQRCSNCHDLTNIYVRRASVAEWHEIVERMVNYGVQLTDAETETIVSYLAESYGTEPT
jgi:hypothetical protein